MVDVIDDFESIQITIRSFEGIADLSNVLYENVVPLETPIPIQFDIANTAENEDTIWWGLYTDDGSGTYPVLVSGTYGSETFLSHQIKTKIMTLQGYASPTIINARLKAGHQE